VQETLIFLHYDLVLQIDLNKEDQMKNKLQLHMMYLEKKIFEKEKKINNKMTINTSKTSIKTIFNN
jgi:hypothetical protein